MKITKELALKMIIGGDLTPKERIFLRELDLRQKIRRVLEFGLSKEEIRKIVKEELK